MSLYGDQVKIGGIPCGLVMRGAANGQYQAVFERERTTLDEIEGIDWDRPVIEGDCILPAGYGFSVTDIKYSSATKSYTVTFQVAQQYLGDVVGYQAQVDELEGVVAAQQEEIASLRAKLTRSDQDEVPEVEDGDVSEGESAPEPALQTRAEEG